MLKVAPAIVPQALLITTGLFGTMTALSLMAKPGSMLKLGVPLAGGAIMLMVCGIGGMFVPVTSAWCVFCSAFAPPPSISFSDDTHFYSFCPSGTLSCTTSTSTAASQYSRSTSPTTRRR